MELLTDTAGILIKKIKPNFKTLGPKYGKLMKQISTIISNYNQEDIAKIELHGGATHIVEGKTISLTLEDVEILSEDIPGWLVANDGSVTVALDVTITPDLKEEGLTREFINRIQNMRKELGLEVTDKIEVSVQKHEEISKAILNNIEYICAETLAVKLNYPDISGSVEYAEVEIADGIKTFVSIKKASDYAN